MASNGEGGKYQNLQAAKKEDGHDSNLLGPLHVQVPDDGHGQKQDHEIGDDGHRRGKVHNRQLVDTVTIPRPSPEIGDGRAYESNNGDTDDKPSHSE